MENFILTLKAYLLNFGSTLWNLWFPLSMLLVCVALAFLISYFIIRKKSNSNEEERLTITKRILTSMYWAGIITLSIATIVVIILQKKTSVFIEEPCQIGIIIGYVIICVFTIVSYVKWGKLIKQKEMCMVDVPLSKAILDNKLTFLKKNMAPHLWGVLLLLLPLGLLFLPFSQQGSLSVVLDNSSSMKDNFQSVSESLSKAMEGSECKNFIFTTIGHNSSSDTIRDPNLYFDNIVNKKSSGEFTEITTSYIESPEEFIGELSNVEANGGSAIYKGIWQNFLVLTEYINGDNKNYPDNRILVVITDGEDDLYSLLGNSSTKWDSRDIFEEENAEGKTPQVFYDGGIYAINYGDESNNMFNDCNFKKVYEGTNMNAYKEAFNDILTKTRFDWVLIWIIAGILIISILILLIDWLSVE